MPSKLVGNIFFIRPMARISYDLIFFFLFFLQYFGQFLKIRDDEKAGLPKSDGFNFRIENHQTR